MCGSVPTRALPSSSVGRRAMNHAASSTAMCRWPREIIKQAEAIIHRSRESVGMEHRRGCRRSATNRCRRRPRRRGRR